MSLYVFLADGVIFPGHPPPRRVLGSEILMPQQTVSLCYDMPWLNVRKAASQAAPVSAGTGGGTGFGSGTGFGKRDPVMV